MYIFKTWLVFKSFQFLQLVRKKVFVTPGQKNTSVIVIISHDLYLFQQHLEVQTRARCSRHCAITR